MPQDRPAEAGEEVHDLVPVGIPEPAAFAAVHDHGQAGVIADQDLLSALQNRLRPTHGRHHIRSGWGWLKIQPGFESRMSRVTNPRATMEKPHLIARNSRYGLVLFVVYVLFYAAFVWLSAFRPAVMAQPFIGGVNLAVCYGFALIIAAFVLAIVYMLLCRAAEGDSQ
jgi:uncharacterized membrane protein (DUF485 family)